MAHAGVERLAAKLDALRLQLAPRRGNVGHAKGDRRSGSERTADPSFSGSQTPSVTCPQVTSKPPVGTSPIEGQAERLEIEPPRPLDVLRRDRQEVDALDLHYPTEPSIWSWISRFISTAYSSGSSFVIGSTKPETIIARASASDRPRDIR